MSGDPFKSPLNERSDLARKALDALGFVAKVFAAVVIINIVSALIFLAVA